MGLKPFRVSFDACIAIYLVEDHPAFAPTIEAAGWFRQDDHQVNYSGVGTHRDGMLGDAVTQ